MIMCFHKISQKNESIDCLAHVFFKTATLYVGSTQKSAAFLSRKELRHILALYILFVLLIVPTMKFNKAESMCSSVRLRWPTDMVLKADKKTTDRQLSSLPEL